MTAILKVDTIQDTSGNNIINESSDTITIGASGDTIALAGTTVTGITQGITEADQWRPTANTTGSSTFITSWERADTYGAGYVGTGMSESSGVFTFPSTGTWLLTFSVTMQNTSTPTYQGFKIATTTDNSSYNTAANKYGQIRTADGYMTGTTSFMFNVTSTSTHKAKFGLDTAQTGTPSINGATNSNNSEVTFIRLGDST